MLNNLSKSERNLLIGLGCALVIFLYVKFLLVPLLNSITDEKSVIKDCKAQVQHIEDVRAENVKLKKKLEDLKVKDPANLLAIPDNQRYPEIERNIKPFEDKETLAFLSIAGTTATPYKSAANTTNSSQNNTTANSGSSGAGTAAKNNTSSSINTSLMVLPVTLTFSGQYPNIITFFDDIEKDKRIGNITSTALTVQQDGSVNGTATVNYYYIDNKSAVSNYDFNTGSYGKDNLLK